MRHQNSDSDSVAGDNNSDMCMELDQESAKHFHRVERRLSRKGIAAVQLEAEEVVEGRTGSRIHCTRFRIEG